MCLCVFVCVCWVMTVFVRCWVTSVNEDAVALADIYEAEFPIAAAVPHCPRLQPLCAKRSLHCTGSPPFLSQALAVISVCPNSMLTRITRSSAELPAPGRDRVSVPSVCVVLPPSSTYLQAASVQCSL